MTAYGSYRAQERFALPSASVVSHRALLLYTSDAADEKKDGGDFFVAG